MRGFYNNSALVLSSNHSLSDGVTSWVRCDMTIGATPNGAVTFYTSTTDTNDPDAVSYTQLSTHTGLNIPVITFDGDLQIGAQNSTNDPFDGKIYRVRIQIDGATQFDADFTSITSAECSAGSFTEDSGNAATVTLTGGTCVADTSTSTGEPGVDMLLLGVPL